MAKREIPLFILDTSKKHRKGDCDFLYCTDIENPFVAKISLLTDAKDEVGADYRICSNKRGVSVKISVARFCKPNPDQSKIRSLLKKALEYYTEISADTINADNPTKDDCIKYLELMIKDNLHNLYDSKSDYNRRKRILISMNLLQASIDYLGKLP